MENLTEYGWGLYGIIIIALIIIVVVIVTLTKKPKRTVKKLSHEDIKSFKYPIEKTFDVVNKGTSRRYRIKQKPNTTGKNRDDFLYYYDDDSLIEDMMMMTWIYFMFDNEMDFYDADNADHLPEFTAVSEDVFISTSDFGGGDELIESEKEEPITEESSKEEIIEEDGVNYVKEHVYTEELKYVEPEIKTEDTTKYSGGSDSYDSGGSDSYDSGDCGGGDD